MRRRDHLPSILPILPILSELLQCAQCAQFRRTGPGVASARSTSPVGYVPILSRMKALLAVATCITLGACAGGGDRVAGNTPVTSSLATCAQGTALLTVSPIAVSEIGGWVPLGAVAPPGHTFPTDHQYIYLATFLTPSAQRPVDLVAGQRHGHRRATHDLLDRRSHGLLAVVLAVRGDRGRVRSRRVHRTVAALAAWHVRPELRDLHAQSWARCRDLLHASCHGAGLGR